MHRLLVLVLVASTASLRAVVRRRPTGAALSVRRKGRSRGLLLSVSRRASWGGADDDDDEDDDDVEDEDDVEDDEDLLDDELDAEEASVSDSDFEGETLKGRAIKAWRETPPVTQAYVATSFGLTLLFFFLNSNVWPEIAHLDWKKAFNGMQFWRPVTAFFFYGPFGVSYLLTMHFVWTYMSTLEKLSHETPWDFAIMLLFGATTLLTAVGQLKLNTRFLAHNLSCYLVYVWARTYEGQEVNVLEFFNIKAELLPWFFAAQTYLLEHEFPLHDLLGIALGHLFVWARQKSLLKAPQIFKDLYLDNPDLMNKYKKIGEEFN